MVGPEVLAVLIYEYAVSFQALYIIRVDPGGDLVEITVSNVIFECFDIEFFVPLVSAG